MTGDYTYSIWGTTSTTGTATNTNTIWYPVNSTSGSSTFTTTTRGGFYTEAVSRYYSPILGVYYDSLALKRHDLECDLRTIEEVLAPRINWLRNIVSLWGNPQVHHQCLSWQIGDGNEDFAEIIRWALSKVLPV